LLSHLYSLTAWSRRHKGKQRIYAVVEPDRERGTSGKYKSVQGITIHEIRALYVVRDSQSNMDAQPNGLTYKASFKFHVAFSELTRIGVVPSQPNLMIAMEGAGLFRATDVAREDNTQLWKLTCDKVRDDFPILAAGWDLTGEAPIGWVANDPVGTLVDWTPELNITNGVITSGDPNIHVDLQEHVHAPAVSLSVDFKIDGSINVDKPLATIILGNSTDPAVADGVVLEIEVVGGSLVIGNGDFSQAIENDTWYSVVVDEEHVTIGGVEHDVDDLAQYGIYVTLSGRRTNDGYGGAAVTNFKNVEVSCNHAI